MKKLWMAAVTVDVVVVMISVLQFDVDDMVIQYVIAIIGAVIMLALLAVGWQWVMEFCDEDRIDDMWEFSRWNRKKK